MIARLLLLAGVLAMVALLTSPLMAASTMTQGFISPKPVKDGELVSTNNNPGIIQKATTANADSMVGVAAVGESALLSVTTTANEVPVATAGIANAILSTANGDIKVGDKITASPLEGVGAKAVKTARVIGVAQASLDAKTPGATKTKVKDKSGKEREVYIAKVPILVSLSWYMLGEGKPNLVPSFLQSIANAIAGRQVSTLPLTIGVIILVITIMSAGVITFTATRSSIISIGRNPLSRGSVIGSLIQVMFLVIGILATGMGAIFLVLRLV